MESNLSCLSSLKEDEAPLYIQPHYKETYRLAIYALLCGGIEAYEEFLRAEQIGHFLSEQEVAFILENAEHPVIEEDGDVKGKDTVSTYFPTDSDEEIPDLDLGWPDVLLEEVDTSISVLFNPPRQNTPSIKEVIRKQIQEAKQLIAVSMDVFTDVDLFKELISATLRGVIVYILLDQNNFSSFLHMSQRVGVSLSELKNLRVRTVQGLQYRCQSSMKFHGGLEQKFLLIDCRTVLYGTYSYTWAFEKLSLSMVLVITGHLVSSYDEEFRRLYARSTVPPFLSREKLQNPVHYLTNPMSKNSPNSSQLFLHQLHLKNRAMNGIQDDRFNNNNNMLTRGVSVQERLHHFPEMGNLVRGHSYGGELPKFNSMTRLRMGTKDIGMDRMRQNEQMLQNRSVQHLRHQSRYGGDHNLIPFNSETSLHKWKMDVYLNGPLDASCDALSPIGSPYNSYTGLNELQSQNMHLRAKDIRARMEETRQKRLSLQEYANLRQSQESLRTMFKSRAMELQQSSADLEAFAHQQNGAQRKESELFLTNGQRSMSHLDFKTMTDRKMPAYDWNQPITKSASDMDLNVNDPGLKLGLGLQPPRPMESLTEIPEEKEAGSRVNSSDLVPQKEERKDEMVVSQEQNPLVNNRQGPPSKTVNSLGKANAKETKKSTLNEGEKDTKIVVSPPQISETKQRDTEKQQETLSLQRKNSVKSKMYSMLTSEDKKASKKDSLPRKFSQKMSGSSQSLKTDSSLGSMIGKQEITPKKGPPPHTSRSQKSSTPSSAAEPEKSKSPLNRFSAQRLSKRKTDSDKGSKSVLNEDGATSLEARKEKAYSRYEYLLGKEDKRSVRLPENCERTVTFRRKDEAGFRTHEQTQAGGENKMGRFMQKMGNLIGNKSK